VRADPKSTKKTEGLTVFFLLLGSGRIKAAHKMLVKLIFTWLPAVVAALIVCAHDRRPGVHDHPTLTRQ